MFFFQSIGIEAAPTFNNKKSLSASTSKKNAERESTATTGDVLTKPPGGGGASRSGNSVARGLDLTMDEDEQGHTGSSWGDDDDCDLSD